MDKQIQAARDAGYSDSEISQYLQQQGQDVSKLNLNQDNGNDPSWNSFIEKAKQIAKLNDFPVSVLLGQAALESGKGTSNFAKNRNNYFGYEAYDSNPDNAKGYQTPEQSIQDYIDLIRQDSRYAKANQTKDPVQMVQEIKNGGYATDPNYVQKVINTPEFKQFYGLDIQNGQ